MMMGSGLQVKRISSRHRRLNEIIKQCLEVDDEELRVKDTVNFVHCACREIG